MLMRPSDSRRSQLLEDLLAVRDRLEKNWCQGGFRKNDNLCIVAACSEQTGREVSNFHALTKDMSAEDDLRFGRMILAIYRALYQHKADLSITISNAQAKIAAFNDGHANHGAVLLLIDRAVAVCMEPVAQNAEA